MENTKQTKIRSRLRWNRILATLFIISFITNIILGILLFNSKQEKKEILLSHVGQEKVVFVEQPKKNSEPAEDKKQEVEIKVEEPEVIEVKKTNYRLTSFWNNDGYGTGSCTGSGLCEKDFQINDKGWYTYKGYLVLASATTYMQKTYGVKNGKDYYKYYDIVNLTIDGVDYQGMILDSCGACSYVSEQRLDLFVTGASSKIDRGYKGNNTIQVWKEG